MSTSAPHYKLDNLRHLVDNNEEAIRHMIAIFCESTPQIVKELNLYFDERNWDMFGKTAHKLKSSLDLFEITELSTSIRELEKLAKEAGPEEDTRIILSRLNTVIGEVLEDLSA